MHSNTYVLYDSLGKWSGGGGGISIGDIRLILDTVQQVRIRKKPA